MPRTEKDYVKFLGGLKQAEDDLARERFRKDVHDEQKRIESVVDSELERMSILEKDIDLDLFDRCATLISHTERYMQDNTTKILGID